MVEEISSCILDINNLYKIYRKPSGLLNSSSSVVALSNINLKVYKGDILSIVGESGSGKTTLAKIIIGLTDYNSGQIIFNSKPLEDFSKKYKIQSISQNPLSSLDPRYTIFESIIEPVIYFMNLNNKEQVYRAEKLCKMVSLDRSLLSRLPHELSGGQVQRAVIARALSTNPDLLICDEITSALDVENKYKILKLLIEINQRNNLTIFFITHDIQSAIYISNRIAIFKDGEIIESGKLEKIINNPKSNYTKELLL